jgi:hypothetical protein
MADTTRYNSIPITVNVAGPASQDTGHYKSCKRWTWYHFDTDGAYTFAELGRTYGGSELYDVGEGEMVGGLFSLAYFGQHEWVEQDEDKLRHHDRELMQLSTCGR